MKKIMLSLLMLTVTLTAIHAQQNEIYAKNGIAINGYDAVAYFTDGKPVKGNETYAVEWKGAKWYFANKNNEDLFKKSPEKFAPQYGGYCAYGCSQGHKAKTEPNAWTIVDGKLYLNYNTDVKGTWDKDRPGYIKKADVNWPKVKGEKFP